MQLRGFGQVPRGSAFYTHNVGIINVTHRDCCGGVEADPLFRVGTRGSHRGHSSLGCEWRALRLPPTSSFFLTHSSFRLTARSCKVNTSGTKASPFPSACTRQRASVWPKTQATCGTTTSSLSPTPNQVPGVLAWAQGRREEGGKGPALQNLGALLEAPSRAPPRPKSLLQGDSVSLAHVPSPLGLL